MSESKEYLVRQVEASQIGLGRVDGPETRSKDGRCFLVRTCIKSWPRRKLKSRVQDDLMP